MLTGRRKNKWTWRQAERLHKLKNREKKGHRKKSSREMWGIVKQTNIHIMGIIREENRKDIPRKNGWKQLKFIEKKKKTKKQWPIHPGTWKSF